MRNAKIVCTLGPASDDPGMIRALADAGMTVARINASHGTRGSREDLLERVRDIDRDINTPVATLLDLQGPEIRTAPVNEPIEIEEGTTVQFAAGETATPERIGLSIDLVGVEPGDRVLLDDGRIETTITAVADDGIYAHVDTGGSLGSRRGVNTPGVALDVEAVTDEDHRELELAVDHGVDFVAASFVRDADDILAVGEILEGLGGEIPIIAKIERDAAVNNLDDIVDAAYAVMIARGDLGVECPLEEVPLIQKRIIRRCQASGVPVITATEMLDSMIHEPRPTRAEASDVANAVLDGTDAVMLSGETAVGDHPVAVVEQMDRIIREIEGSDEYAEFAEQRVPAAERTGTDALARSARYLARDVGAHAVVVASESGYTALKTAKFRPSVPIVAATPTDRVRRQLALSWGVRAEYADLAGEGAAGVIENAVGAALASGQVESGDTVVVLSGMMTDLDRSTTNTLKVHVAAETIGAGRGVVGGRAVGVLTRSEDGDLADIPESAVLYLSGSFEGEFEGDTSKLVGIVHERPGMTGYPALVARELGIPMASGLTVPGSIPDGTTVTIDGERGVVYAGDITRRPIG